MFDFGSYTYKEQAVGLGFGLDQGFVRYFQFTKKVFTCKIIISIKKNNKLQKIISVTWQKKMPFKLLRIISIIRF